MKQVNIKMPFRMLVLLLGLFLSVGAFAQINVKGHVKDAQGEPIIGATVRVANTQTATITDFDGNFTLKANAGADIVVSSSVIRMLPPRPLLIWRLCCRTIRHS